MDGLATESEREFREIVATVATPAEARQLAAQLRTVTVSLIRMRSTVERAHRDGLRRRWTARL
jgi:hypothetical protein